MGRLFCPLCGKTVEKLYDGLCEECYRRAHPLVESPDKLIEITLCPSCLSFKLGRKWVVPGSQNDPLREAITRSIKQTLNSKSVKAVKVVDGIDMVLTEKSGTLRVAVTGHAHRDMSEYVEEYSVPIKIEYRYCPTCKDIKSKRELARIQIRALNRELTKKEIELAEKVSEEELRSLYERDRGAVPIEVKIGKKGIDYAFSSHHIARSLALKLQKVLSADLLETHKEIGVSEGRKLLRITYRLLLPPFREGDVIERSGRLYYVLSISGSSVRLLSLKELSEKTLKLSRGLLDKVKVVYRYEELPIGMIVSVTPPYVQVMSMDEYAVYELYLRRVPLWMKEGGEIRIIKHASELYIAPVKRDAS
ncbi:MAG TPA: hypothetical protein ENF80_02320 [Thermofilum sp.]|nr:hypothetical protein [Thermofilum sp.]